MPVFRRNEPVETREAVVKVEAGNLQPGTYRFQLVVIDDTGQESAPDVVTVRIRPRIERVERRGGRRRPNR